MLDLEKVKPYLRVTDIEDDALIYSMIIASSSLIKGQTGKSFYKGADIEDDELYILAVKMLVAHWYDNRGMTQYGKVSEISLSAQAIIDHIKLDGDYTW